MGGPPACCLSLETAFRISHHFFSPVGVTPYAAAQVSWGFGSRGMVPGRVEVPEGRLVSYHPLSRSRRGQRCRVIVIIIILFMQQCRAPPGQVRRTTRRGTHVSTFWEGSAISDGLRSAQSAPQLQCLGGRRAHEGSGPLGKSGWTLPSKGRNAGNPATRARPTAGKPRWHGRWSRVRRCVRPTSSATQLQPSRRRASVWRRLSSGTAERCAAGR